jgi:hypothetical protein
MRILQTDALAIWRKYTSSIQVQKQNFGMEQVGLKLHDLGTAREHAKGAGPSGSAAICFGGNTPSETAATEEWTVAPAPSFQKENLGQVFYNSTSDAFKVTQQSVPGGTWSSGENLNTARSEEGAGGTQTAL